jgi:glycosyltransferase involved in cell wall biosynthesis
MYNKEQYIQRTLNSVQRQVVTDYEVLIVDDGSTDGSAAAVEPFLNDRRFRLIRQQNTGEGGARNRGLREAAGSITAFIDADDEWLPSHIQSILNLAALFPTAGFYATGYRSIYRNNFSVSRTINRRSPCLIQDYYRFAASGHSVHISSVAMKRCAATSGVFFSENERIGADLEFYLRLSLKTTLAYDPRISSIYRCDIQGSVMSETVWSRDMPLTGQYLANSLAENQIPRSLIPSAQMYLRRIVVGHALSGLSLGRKAEALALLTLSSGLDEVEKSRLQRVRSILQWIPQGASSATIRLFNSRWGLKLGSLSATSNGTSGQPRAHSKIVWRSHVPGRGNSI